MSLGRVVQSKRDFEQFVLSGPWSADVCSTGGTHSCRPSRSPEGHHPFGIHSAHRSWWLIFSERMIGYFSCRDTLLMFLKAGFLFNSTLVPLIFLCSLINF